MRIFDLSLKLNGFNIDKARAALADIQAKTDAEFETYINAQKKRIISYHLEHNSFYKALGKTVDVNDWNSVPIITKKHLQQPLEQRLSDGFTPRNVYVNKTSGSSGDPFIFAKDKWCHALTWAEIMNRFGWYGIDFNSSKQARFYGIPLDKKGYYKERLKDYFGNRFRFSVFDLSDAAFDETIAKFKTDTFEFINGYTSPIVQFAKYLKQKDLLLKTICPSLKVCIVTSEMLFDDDKALMEKQFGVPVVNEYGASELDLIAFQNQKDEWQVNSETLFVEILDDNGSVLPYGEEGRIVITSLYNKAHPFIRYDIGDVGILARDSATELHLQSLGFAALPAEQALTALGHILQEDFTQVGLIKADWPKWVRAMPTTGWQRLESLLDEDNTEEKGLQQQLKALDIEEATTLVRQSVLDIICGVLKYPQAQYLCDKPIKDYGVDSLTAVELQIHLENYAGCAFTTIELLGGKSTDDLVAKIIAGLNEGEVSNTDQKKSPTPTPVTVSPSELRAFLLDNICVQEPYFDLHDLQQEPAKSSGNCLSAKARFAEATDNTNASNNNGGTFINDSNFSIAEASRHMAILGSCAIRLDTSETGRIYYPVKKALLKSVNQHVNAINTKQCRIRAWTTNIDQHASIAIADALVEDENGNVLCDMEITYHIIPEAAFQHLFADNYLPTNRHINPDAYLHLASMHDKPLSENSDGSWHMPFGKVGADMCEGHFVDYPAYPVSIMLRNATDFLSRVLANVHGQAGESFLLQSGVATAERLIFVGEIASYKARKLMSLSGHESWEVEIYSDKGSAAKFQMSVYQNDKEKQK